MKIILGADNGSHCQVNFSYNVFKEKRETSWKLQKNSNCKEPYIKYLGQGSEGSCEGHKII